MNDCFRAFPRAARAAISLRSGSLQAGVRAAVSSPRHLTLSNLAPPSACLAALGKRALPLPDDPAGSGLRCLSPWFCGSLQKGATTLTGSCTLTFALAFSLSVWIGPSAGGKAACPENEGGQRPTMQPSRLPPGREP